MIYSALGCCKLSLQLEFEMKLTVANRIIGGFGIILVLLSVIGAKAYLNFVDVEQDTFEAKSISIPTLQLSNELQNSLMTIQRLSLFEYYSEDLNNLTKFNQQLKTNSQLFNETLSKLKTLGRKNPELLNEVSAIESSNSTIVKNSNSLYLSKKKSIELGSKLTNNLSEFTDLSDDFSSLLLDISDLTSEDNQAALDTIIGMAADLDNLTLTLVQTNEDVAKQPSIVKTQAVGKELGYIDGDIKVKLDFMLTRGNEFFEQELNEELINFHQQLKTFSVGPQSVAATRVAIIQEEIKTQRIFNEGKAQIDQTNAVVFKLLNAASDDASQSQERVLDRVTSSKSQILILILVAIVLAVIIAYQTVNSITKPLNKINKLLNQLAGGDLTQTVEQNSSDEFGTLAKNINHLAASLKTLISSISQGSIQLATASEETSAITNQTTQAIGEQRLQVDQAANATTELNSSAQDVATHATTTLDEIAKTSEQAQEIAKISANNTDTIGELSQEISSASEVINKLHEDSTNIGSIIDVIRGIAEQTNLLALNAAIEAARAGEQGRGFAVVADEVRNLANRTQQSTQEINNMIDLIQSGAIAAVKVMDTSQQRATSCVEHSEQAAVALANMNQTLEHVHQNSNKISNAAQEQRIVSQEISQLLEKIVEIAQETSQGAHDTAQASSEVAILADGLQHSAAQFKV